MTSLTALGPFVLLVSWLCAKFLVLIGLQGFWRLRTRSFRWAEDAAHWGGRACPGMAESGPVERAQAALRNDAESQGLFALALWAWIALGAPAAWAYAVVAVYAAARSLHSYWLVTARQPRRNRAFGASVLCLLVVVVDCLRRLT